MKILNEEHLPQLTQPISHARTRRKTSGEGQYTISAFRTALGWMGLLGLDDELVSAFVGHPSARSVNAAASQNGAIISNGDWNPSIRGLLEAYAEGESVDFSDVELRLPLMTPFRLMIVRSTRQIRYGETTTYGELAQRIGHPGAARAVGTVMSTNRFPIIIPCHRVLAAGGRLGGYTSPAGLELKRRMLRMEEQGSGAYLGDVRPKWELVR